MKKAFISLVALILLAVNPGRLHSEIIDTISGDIQHGFRSGLSLVKSPGSFDRQDWTVAGAYLAGTGLLFLADEPVRDLARRSQSPLNDRIFSFDSWSGNQYSLFLGMAVYGAGLTGQNTRLREAGRNAVEAFVFSGGITAAAKVLFSRERPYSAQNAFTFRPIQLTDNRYLSLPSGHTTVSFAVSTVFAKSTDSVALKAACYTVAGLTAASRIYHDRHWLSDTFLGAGIGYFVGSWVTQHPASRNHLHAVITPSGFGVEIPL